MSGVSLRQNGKWGGVGGNKEMEQLKGECGQEFFLLLLMVYNTMFVC